MKTSPRPTNHHCNVKFAVPSCSCFSFAMSGSPRCAFHPRGHCAMRFQCRHFDALAMNNKSASASSFEEYVPMQSGSGCMKATFLQIARSRTRKTRASRDGCPTRSYAKPDWLVHSAHHRPSSVILSIHLTPIYVAHTHSRCLVLTLCFPYSSSVAVLPYAFVNFACNHFARSSLLKNYSLSSAYFALYSLKALRDLPSRKS